MIEQQIADLKESLDELTTTINKLIVIMASPLPKDQHPEGMNPEPAQEPEAASEQKQESKEEITRDDLVRLCQEKTRSGVDPKVVRKTVSDIGGGTNLRNTDPKHFPAIKAALEVLNG